MGQEKKRRLARERMQRWRAKQSQETLDRLQREDAERHAQNPVHMGRPRRVLTLEEKREANRLRQQRFRDKRRRQQAAAIGQNGDGLTYVATALGNTCHYPPKQFEATWKIVQDTQLQASFLRGMQPGLEDEQSDDLNQPSTSGFSLQGSFDQNNPASITPDIDDDSSSSRTTLPPASQFCEVSLKDPASNDVKPITMPVKHNDILAELNVTQLHKLAPQLLRFKFYVKCTKFGLRLVLLQDDYVSLSVEICATQEGCRTELKVLGKLLPSHHPITELLGSPSNISEVARFIEKLEDWKLCPGNPEIGSSIPHNAWRCSRTGVVYSNQCLGLVVQEKCYNCQQCAISIMNS